MLQTRVRIHHNPWNHRVPDERLVEILTSIVKDRETHLRHEIMKTNLIKGEGLEGTDARPSFAFVILDPTAPISRPSEETILAVLEIGPNSQDYIPYAIAKAIWHRDHGRRSDYGVYVDTLTSADGDSAWGFSCQVDDTIGGGCDDAQEMAEYEAGVALVTFNHQVRKALREWFESQEERPDWFCNSNQPDKRFTGAVQAALTRPLYDSSQPQELKMPLAYSVARF